MTIYHYIGYYIGSLIIVFRNSKSDRLPQDSATFLEDLQQAGVSCSVSTQN